MNGTAARQKGFTIVELLIVIIVISILVAVTTLAYNGVQDRARQADITSDLDHLGEAIYVARSRTHQRLSDITGSVWTGQYCAFQPNNPSVAIPDGTDMSAHTSMTQPCWDSTNSALAKISDASGIDVTGLLDPWGRPYYIDENDSAGTCNQDVLGWLSYPYKGGNNQNSPVHLIPTDPSCSS